MTAKLAQLHQNGAAFDGVIASDDNLALSAVKFAKSLGRKIPEEFSVIGYNHSLLAQCSSPSRSPIRQRGTY